MAGIFDIPDNLRYKNKEKEFFNLLSILDLSKTRKKQLLIEWTKIVSVPLTADLFVRAGLGS